MTFDLKDVLQTVGPTASLVFAAWIFLTFLQQRYVSAYERYRALIEGYRQNQTSDARHQNIKDQVLLYKKRCEQMRLATNIGVISAIFLITTLITAALHAMFKSVTFFAYVSALSALVGLGLVICAAILVIMENTSIQYATESQLADIPDLATEGKSNRRSQVTNQV